MEAAVHFQLALKDVALATFKFDVFVELRFKNYSLIDKMRLINSTTLTESGKPGTKIICISEC